MSSLLLQCLKTGKEEVAPDLLSVVRLQSQIAQSLATRLCLGAQHSACPPVCTQLRRQGKAQKGKKMLILKASSKKNMLGASCASQGFYPVPFQRSRVVHPYPGGP